MLLYQLVTQRGCWSTLHWDDQSFLRRLAPISVVETLAAGSLKADANSMRVEWRRCRTVR